METGAERQVLSNANGDYLVLLLQPGGPYEIEIGSLGYATFRRENLMLQVGDVTTIDATLDEQAIELEGVAVAVERAEIFNPQQVGPATLLSERVVEAVPLLSRDITELAVLSPLVQVTQSGGFSVAGQNDRYNALLIDGVLNKDMFGLTSGGVPGGQAGAKLIPLDAVTQYEILVAPFDVRLSGFTGGVMNAVTRSGTNETRVRAEVVTRNEALIGDLQLPTGPVEASGIDRSLVALSIGGPIQRNKSHYYISGEFETRRALPAGFNLFRDDPRLVRIGPDALTNMTDIFTGQFGGELGTGEIFSLNQDLANVFGRLDWNFDDGSRLTIRNIFSHTSNDQSPNRTAFEPYELSSNAIQREGTANSTSVQLFSPIGDRMANQMDLRVNFSSDETTPVSTLPQFDVGVLSSIDGSAFNRPVRFGGNFFGQENSLSQTAINFTNALDINTGDDILTVGVAANYYDIGHSFLPGANGEYFFASVTDLENNAPQRFQRTVIEGGADPQIDFSVLEVGSFIQTQLNAGKGLSMRFGLRVDVPYVFGAPQTNFDILDFYGFDTGSVPSGNVMISPRWGFNWQSEGEKRTQVRMGAGMFAGQLPYVWLANAFHNDGVRSVTQTCQGRITDDPGTPFAVPSYVPGSLPTACQAAPFQLSRSAVVFPDNFRYPQDLKAAINVDRELTTSLSATFGVLMSRAVNQIGLRELNIDRTAGSGPALELGGQERRFYRGLNGRYSQVLEVTNEGQDNSAAVSVELRGRIGDRLNLQMGYAYTRSFDRVSLQFADMQSNFGFTPVEVDANDPRVSRSVFDRPHKIVLSVFGRPIPWLPETEVSLLYTGQSGLPFSYVYGFDLNGDGYPGTGAAFDRNNDLIYVPERATDLPASLGTIGLFARAMESDDCIRANIGQIMGRNECRAPWQNQLDIRVAHTFDIGGAAVRLQGDMVNFLNFLNGEWGTIESIRSVVPLLEESTSDAAFVQWGGASIPIRGDDGEVGPADPWDVQSPASQWQVQLGARVTLGGAR